MDEVCRQYFAMTPLRILKTREEWNCLVHEDSQQNVFLKEVFNSHHARMFPVSKKYSKSFLKALINDLESSGNEVIEELYNEYLSLLHNELSEEYCYKTYYLRDSKKVIMREATSMLSSGTTGLVSWQAAFAMCDWVNSNLEHFNGKSILELGCGSGLLGVFICKFAHPSAYTFTDCHDKVLNFLRKNLYINNVSVKNDDLLQDELKLKDEKRGRDIENTNEDFNKQPSVLDCECCKTYELDTLSSGKPLVNVAKVDWTEFQSSDRLRGQPIDIIVGTDLVFDSAIVPSLVKVMAYILSQSEKSKAFISTTIRNEKTYEVFTSCLDQNRLLWKVTDKSNTGHLFEHDNSTNIEILEITKDSRPDAR